MGRAAVGDAERQRRRRARQAAGLVVLQLELDEVAVAEMLVNGGLLDPRCADEKQAIEAALAKQVAILCRLPRL